MSQARNLVLLHKDRPVFFLRSNVVSVIARVEWEFEHTFWSFLGCSRVTRLPCVNIHAWTSDTSRYVTSIRTDTQDEAFELVESLIAQIPVDLNEDLDEEDVFVETDAPEDEPPPTLPTCTCTHETPQTLATREGGGETVPPTVSGQSQETDGDAEEEEEDAANDRDAEEDAADDEADAENDNSEGEDAAVAPETLVIPTITS